MSADELYMNKFLMTHGGFMGIVVLLLLPKCTGHRRALHSTNTIIALYTITLGNDIAHYQVALAFC